MWCISVQELEAVVVDHRATSLLTAIVHAIDNPFCSLSTTFEAVQVFCILELIPTSLPSSGCAVMQ